MPPRVELALLHAASAPMNPGEDRPFVAVATREGVLVNQHLGEAERLAIYGPDKACFRLVETRPTPPPGGGRDRWLALADVLHDCRALLVASAGEAPRTALAERGIKVLFMDNLIEEGLDAVYRGAEIRFPLRRQHRCGSGCAETAKAACNRLHNTTKGQSPCKNPSITSSSATVFGRAATRKEPATARAQRTCSNTCKPKSPIAVSTHRLDHQLPERLRKGADPGDLSAGVVVLRPDRGEGRPDSRRVGSRPDRARVAHGVTARPC